MSRGIWFGGGGELKNLGAPSKKFSGKQTFFLKILGKEGRRGKLTVFSKNKTYKIFQTLVGYNGGGGEGGGVKNMFSNFFLPQFFREFLII